MVSELCGHLSVRGGQGRRRGQGSSFEASSAVTLSSSDWMAAALLPDAAVFSVGCQSEGQLPCGDVRAVSHLSVVQDLGILPVTGPSNMFTYVLADALVQWLRRRPRS